MAIGSATTGASSRCTGYATPSTARTTPPSAPGQDPASWPACATSQSAPTISPADVTSPKPVARPAASCTDPSRSSSQHDLETTLRLRAELHSMLIYGKGQFFLP